jgi:hypothetical protein
MAGCPPRNTAEGYVWVPSSRKSDDAGLTVEDFKWILRVIVRVKWLSAIIHEGDAEAMVKEKQEKALAEHVARHPEDAGRTVEDFKWFLGQSHSATQSEG